MNILEVSPQCGTTSFEGDSKPRISFLRTLRANISPCLISLSRVKTSTVLKEFLGSWSSRYSNVGNLSFCSPTFKVTAFGRPLHDMPVSLFCGEELIDSANTDENGEVTFILNFSKPGVYNYVAVVGKSKPLTVLANSRIYPFKISVWFICTKSKNLTDVWARLQGRSFFRPLPVVFWNDMPESVVGLAGTNVGYVDLVPCIDGITIPMELGVSAYCNTPEPYPSAERCCEYARNTWWQFDVYATNDPEKVADTIKEANHIGGDRINLDYHLKYSISSSNVTFNGRYLKQVRCPWEEGTAPMG